MLESIVLLPIGAAFYQVCSKVSSLRQEVADRDIQIEALQAAVDSNGSTTGSSTSTGAGGGAGRVAIIAGLAISGAAAVYQGSRLLYRIRQNTATTAALGTTTAGGEEEEGVVVIQSAPPPGYQPQKAASDQEACIVFLHNVKDTLVMPCSHMALCWVCAETLAGGGGLGGGETPSSSPSPTNRWPGLVGDAATSGSANSRTEGGGGDTPQPRRVIIRRLPQAGGTSTATGTMGNAAPPAALPPPLCPVCRGDIKSLTFAYVA